MISISQMRKQYHESIREDTPASSIGKSPPLQSIELTHRKQNSVTFANNNNKKQKADNSISIRIEDKSTVLQKLGN